MGASKGASKSEGKEHDLSTVFFPTAHNTTLHWMDSQTDKLYNGLAVIRWRGTPREPEDLQDLTERHGKNTVETDNESLA